MKRLSKLFVSFLAFLLIAALVASTPASASAQNKKSDVEQAVDKTLDLHPEKALPDTGVFELVLDESAASGELRVNRKLTAPEAIDEESQASVISVTAHGVGNNHAMLSSGRAQASDSSSDTLATANDNGIQIFTVLRDKKAAKRTYTFSAERDGERLSFIENDAGEILVGSGTEDDFLAYGTVDAPWAYDAEGREVSVSYHIPASGKMLQMRVHADKDSAYPIVADPAWSFWAGVMHCSWGSCTFYLERAKTYWVRDQLKHLDPDNYQAIVGSYVVNRICDYVRAAVKLPGWKQVAYYACKAAVAYEIRELIKETNGTYRCLTFRRYHWEDPYAWFLPKNMNHAHGSAEHCHYNV